MEEASLMITGHSTDLRVQQNIIKNQFIGFVLFIYLFIHSFIWPIVFGSTLGLYAIQFPVPGYLGSVGHGFPLMAWASS